MITATLVRATGANTTEPCTILKDSHSCPVFVDARVRLLELRFDDRLGVRGRLLVSGKVRSDLCDLIPGAAGTISEIGVYANGEFLTAVPTQVTKQAAQKTFIHPFPMFAGFEADLGDIELSPGQNYFELLAVDSIPGVGLTGYAEFRTQIDAENVAPPETPEVLTRSTPPPLSVAQKEVWRMSCKEPYLAVQSKNGDTNVYYVRISGGPQILETLSHQSKLKVTVGSDGHYYLGDETNGPQANVLLASCNNPINEVTDSNSGTFEMGFLKGLLYKGSRFVCGSLRLGFSSANNQGLPIMIGRDAIGSREHTLVLASHCALPTSVYECSRAVQALYEFAQAVNQKNHTVVESVARMDWEPLCEQSRDVVMVGLYCLEVLKEVWRDFGQNGSLGTCGEIQGRVCLESLACVLAKPRHGTLRKIDVLNQLKNVDYFHENKRSSLLDKVIAIWRSGPFASFDRE